jgi:predicted DNA-binding transcriptional regulator AlpA
MANPNPPLQGLGNRPIAWLESEVDAFIHARVRGKEWSPKPAAELPERPILIRKSEVCRRVGLSYPTIWGLEKAGRFPRHVSLLARAIDEDDAAE